MNAIGACGLQLYNFGQTVSLVFFTDTWKPDSFYDRVKENADLGMLDPRDRAHVNGGGHDRRNPLANGHVARR